MKKSSFLRKVGLGVAVLAVFTVMVWGGEVDSKNARSEGARKTFTAGGVEFAMRWIPAGSFMMGSPSNEAGRFYEEGPQRRVEISKGFWMLETEVTQGQYKALVGSNPSKFKKCGENCPVEQVSWYDARRFASKLSRAQGLSVCSDMDREIFKCVGWRLPTEAEWEYAARAGTTGARYGPLDNIAWYSGNSGVKYEGGFDCSGWKEKQYKRKRCGTHPVGGKRPNVWGLYDMLGNVAEWTMDEMVPYQKIPAKALMRKGDGTYYKLYTDPIAIHPVTRGGGARVARGGSWGNYARDVRSAVRGNAAPSYRDIGLGFRLLRY